MLNKDIEITLLSLEEVGDRTKDVRRALESCDKSYWTRTVADYSSPSHAVEYGIYDFGRLELWGVECPLGIRPVLKSDNLNELIKDCKSYMDNGIQVIEYGNFPHMLENVEIDNPNFLQATGQQYILPTNLSAHRFSLARFKEYDYNGQKIVKSQNLYHPVKPVKWYVDRINNMLIAQDVLFEAPINVNKLEDYDGFFETSELYRYLNNAFLKQLLASEKLNRVNADKPDDVILLETKLEKLKERKKVKITQLKALLTRQEKLQQESAKLDAKIAELTQSLNQKVKR